MKKEIAVSRPDRDIAYLIDCSDEMLENFILEKVSSAARHAKAIQAEQRAMIQDLADADVARVIQTLRGRQIEKFSNPHSE